MNTRPSRTLNPILAMALLAALASSACSYHRALIHYEEYDDQVVMQSASWPGERLGPVRAYEGGAVWDDCTQLARNALWLIIEQAEEMNGNAIGDIRWFADCSEEPLERPTCKRRWGWILLWPGLLTPAFMGAEVDAVVYRLPAGMEPGREVNSLPESHQELELLVERLVEGKIAEGPS